MYTLRKNFAIAIALAAASISTEVFANSCSNAEIYIISHLPQNVRVKVLPITGSATIKDITLTSQSASSHIKLGFQNAKSTGMITLGYSSPTSSMYDVRYEYDFNGSSDQCVNKSEGGVRTVSGATISATQSSSQAKYELNKE